MKPKLVIFDFDNTIYTCGFATEKRSVVVTHIPTGRTMKAANKTEFYGAKKKEIGGWLAQRNAERIEKGLKPFEREEFEFETVRESEPVAYVLSTVKNSIKNTLRELDCENYTGFIGKGVSFREDLSTIWKYKGNRENVLRPLLKDEIVDYLVQHHFGKIVTGLEADDWCVIEGVRNPNSVVVAVDKDAMGFPIKVFNPNLPEWGIVDGNCFGELGIVTGGGKSKDKDVKGYGRKFFYFQLAYGDDIDNYRSNSATETLFGKMGAYEALQNATTDAEALEAVVAVYKMLYPEPKEIVGWRGDTILIDWKYVLNENWNMARMYRTENDIVTVESVLKKFNLWE